MTNTLEEVEAVPRRARPRGGGARGRRAGRSGMSGRIAVAMSGGLDSSVAALLLARPGCRWWASRCSSGTTPPTRRRPAPGAAAARSTWATRAPSPSRSASRTTRCAWTSRSARAVVDPFVDDYLAGRTPSPCVRCNTAIKFDLLFDRARTLGAERVATGHYARIATGPDGPELHRAVDEAKDQSYFLFELTAEQLSRTLFPLGGRAQGGGAARSPARPGWSSPRRARAWRSASSPDSVRAFVERQAAERPERFDGAARGAGDGGRQRGCARSGTAAPYYRYTVGQRRGLGVAAGSSALRLARACRRHNRVVVRRRPRSPRPACAASGCTGSARDPVRARSRRRCASARATPASPRASGRSPSVGVEVEFATPNAGWRPGRRRSSTAAAECSAAAGSSTGLIPRTASEPRAVAGGKMARMIRPRLLAAAAVSLLLVSAALSARTSGDIPQPAVRDASSSPSAAPAAGAQASGANPAGAPQTSGPADQARATSPPAATDAPLSRRWSDWLAEVAPLITDAERAAFLALPHDYEREQFVRRFWQVRDPYPQTGRNELEERWQERVKTARQQLARSRGRPGAHVPAHGPPASTSKPRCSALVRPVEVWTWQEGDLVKGSFAVAFVQPAGRPDGRFRIWEPSEGLRSLLLAPPPGDDEAASQCRSRGGVLPRRGSRRCARRHHQLEPQLARGVGPKAPDPEWLQSFSAHRPTCRRGPSRCRRASRCASPGGARAAPWCRGW